MEEQSQTSKACQTPLLFYCISEMIHFEQLMWSIWLECSAGSETSIPIIQSLSLFQSIPCLTFHDSHLHGIPKTSRRRSKWVLCCSICALFTGAAVSFEAQHVFYAGHGFLSAGCHFGWWRHHTWGTGDGDHANPHGIPQKIQKAARQRAHHQVKRMWHFWRFHMFVSVWLSRCVACVVICMS